MRSMNEIRKNDFNLEASFTRLCQQAEQEDRQAMLRFRSWFKGLMDPEEDAVYTEAVEQCARSLRKDAKSA